MTELVSLHGVGKIFPNGVVEIRLGTASTSGNNIATGVESDSHVPASATGALTEIHERMPLVLPRDRWAEWLDPAREDVEALALPTPPELVETLEIRPVSTAVNNVANNGPELLARAEAVREPADQPALF